MIVNMQKITLLVQDKRREAALKKLRELGVLHIHNVQNPSSNDITSIETELASVQKAKRLIGDENIPQKEANLEQASIYIEKILSLAEEKDRLLRELEEHQENRRWFQNWGAVSYASLQKLREAGITVRFYTADKNALKNIPVEKKIHVVKEEKGTIYFAFFAESPDDHLDHKQDFMPNLELSNLEDRMTKIQKSIEKIDSELRELRNIRNMLEAYHADVEKRLEFSKVMYSMGEVENISYLQGFSPVDTIAVIKKTATEEGWAYLIQDPDEPFETPTLLHQPRWLQIVNPIFNFMGALPGYKELDISFWFLLFFSLFFGIIIGDAGYGLIFLLLSFFLSRKMKNAPREPFILLSVLSVATIIWGVISGNWFGFQKIGQLPFLNFMIINQMDAFVDANQMFIMYLCFLIAAIHLTVAHGLSAVRYMKSPAAIAEVGWIFVVWTLFFAANNLVLKKAFPGFMAFVFLVGVLMILVFANFQKNVLKGVAKTLSSLPLDIISSFSDVVSYLRLFAVGYATVTVALSFNSMAGQLGFGSVVASLISALILFLGHSLNIILALMSVIVHGIRLNMLEFSGHLNMQWSGRKYDPFKE
jgi:V/A-type H+-transporting ATPase subunit I